MSTKLLATLKTFLVISGELVLLFIGISFLVAMLQKYFSTERTKVILGKPRGGLENIVGAMLGAVTPFCSCSTIPILVALFKAGAPFGGAISFLIASPILNPAIIGLFLIFFGLKATLIYVASTFIFAVLVGKILDKLGMKKEVKSVVIQGGHPDGEGEIDYSKLTGSFIDKQKIILKASLFEAVALFKEVFPYLLIGASIGAFIYGFIPDNWIVSFTIKFGWLAIPVAAIIGIPMYIRVETMIPIAGILISKGMSSGAVVALIIGGAGASIPELTMLTSIFKKKMVMAFIISILTVATVTGYLFDILL